MNSLEFDEVKLREASCDFCICGCLNNRLT